MRLEKPPDEAYGRVTNPERYQAVVNAARDLFDGLVETYDVSVAAGVAAEDFPRWQEPDIPTTRLIPARGVPITVMYTNFPGVVLTLGELWRYGPYDGFPSCGCDACDESPPQLVDEMHSLVMAAVEGRYREGLTKTRRWRGWDGNRSWNALRRGEWKEYGELRELSWEPWPRRGLI